MARRPAPYHTPTPPARARCAPGAAGVWHGDPNNDPGEAEFVVALTFASETGGAFEYTYTEGDRGYPAVEGDFEIVEGRIDAADCQR